MWKLLSLFVLPFCLLTQSSDAYAVTAAVFNASPFCVCIRAKSAGALKDGDKNCASSGKTTHSSTAGADYIRSVQFTTYATNACRLRTKSMLIKEMSGTRTFNSAMGRATKVHFAAYGALEKGVGPDGKKLINFRFNKIPWMTYCAHVKSEDACIAQHEKEKEEEELAVTLSIAGVGGVLFVGSVIGAIALGDAMIGVGVGGSILGATIISAEVGGHLVRESR